MAILSYGYGVDENNTYGEIGAIAWAEMATFLGAQYAVGEGSFTPAIPVSGDRTVNLGSGSAFSHGVLVKSDATESIQLDEPTPGTTRWYIVGLEYDWQTALTTWFVVYSGASIAAALAILTVSPGVKVQHPLVAARVVAGQAKVQELVDLRLFGSGSSFTASTTEVRNFANRPGTILTINGEEHRRVVSGGVMTWTTSSLGTSLGRRPSIMLARNTPRYSHSTAAVWLVGATIESDDDRQTVGMGAAGGGTQGSPSRLTFARAGLYALGCRISTEGTVGIREYSHFGIFGSNGGFRPSSQVVTSDRIRQRSGAETYGFTDTRWLSAGTHLGIVLDVSAAVFVTSWRLWATWIGD